MKNGVTAVELFCGIGGFRIACDELEVETLWSNDLDKKASMVYMDCFGSEGHINGNIWEHLSDVPNHKLLTAGFPCQPFSSAGKKLGIKDERGTLFSAIIEILKKQNPEYFVLENVKRLLSMDSGRHFATILLHLSELGYQVEWRLLNAIDFGLPQYRERVVIIGHKKERGITFLCNDGDLEKISSKELETVVNLKNWTPISKCESKFKKWGFAKEGRFAHIDLVGFSDSMDIVKLKDVLEDSVDKSFFFTEDTEERIKNSEKVNRYVNEVEILYNQRGGARMGYSIFGTGGVAPTLTCTTSRHYERYKVGNSFRRLTNVEYARIQGFPDNHCKSVTRYNQYSLYGNAVPPKMVKWVLNKLLFTEGYSFFKKPIQGSLFA